ncbi:DUF2892 domain-containing protein [Saccharopolyspora sp. WRP15-2]|uniref:DUF2892 domain-containing protein n=1 Tax=Saccharopolyspora oryzae TaxID=2997343 RepID=A0ABT4V2J8_9PSEU|nr:YgaP-like transmembrane domain [Saccharopolyspora oryzae]MDA3628189.1 DUF2892 domain-containing protein [Saccharopolyspora oryzae]
MRRPVLNITPPERVGRVVVGLAAILAGALLLTSTSGLLAIALDILLALAGADLAVTGALGHCPLYRSLGYTPASLEHRTP